MEGNGKKAELTIGTSKLPKWKDWIVGIIYFCLNASKVSV